MTVFLGKNLKGELEGWGARPQGQTTAQWPVDTSTGSISSPGSNQIQTDRAQTYHSKHNTWGSLWSYTFTGETWSCTHTRVFKPNMGLKSHMYERKEGILWQKYIVGHSGFLWANTNLRHFLDVPSETDSGGDGSGASMLGMWFYGGSQHTASLAFCNWAALSKSCSPAQLSRLWQGVDRLPVCVFVCHLMPLSWTPRFPIQVFVFFGQSDAREPKNSRCFFKMTTNSITPEYRFCRKIITLCWIQHLFEKKGF